MDIFVAAEKAIESALDALGMPADAQFMLRDILPEEVSLVDRAANRRRFLVVKLNEDDSMAKRHTVSKAMISKPVKQALMAGLTEATERLVSVLNAVKTAEETEGETDVPVPEEIAGELKAVSGMLSALNEKYPSPTAKADGAPAVDDGAKDVSVLLSSLGSEAGDKLKVIGQMIAMVADAASPDDLAQIAQTALGGVNKRMADGSAAAKLVAALSAAAGAVAKSTDGSVPADASDVLAGALPQPPAAEPPVADPATGEPATQAKTDDQPPAADPPVADPTVAEPPPAPAPAITPEDVGKMIATAVDQAVARINESVEKRMTEVSTRVSKALDIPTPPATPPVEPPAVTTTTPASKPRKARRWVA